MRRRRWLIITLLLSLFAGMLPAPFDTSAAASNTQTLDLNFGATSTQKVNGKYFFNTPTLTVSVPLSSSRPVKSYTYTVNGSSQTVTGPVSGNKITFTANGKKTTVFGEGGSNPGFIAERSQDGKSWVIGAKTQTLM